MDLANRPVGYEQFATFHPTFLYEALWSLGIAGLLVLIDRSRKLRPGELFAVYVLGYAIGRFWVEGLRIDHASLIWGIRINEWMSVVIGVGAALYLVISRRRPAPEVAREHEAESGPSPSSTATVDPAVDDVPVDVDADADADADVDPAEPVQASDGPDPNATPTEG